MTTRVFTYEELAEHYGITKKSAQNLARKKGWHRTLGNDRKARIHVPLEGPKEVNDDVPDQKTEILVLKAKIEGMERTIKAEQQRADAAEQDRDRWHEYATRKRDWFGFFRR